MQQARTLALAFAAAGGGHQADHLLGLIHCRQGNLVEGIARLRSALEADPDNPSYRLMLARALVDADAPAEALAVTRSAPSAQGAAALALLGVEAEAAAKAGDSAAEAQAHRGLVAARSADWRAWNDLGSALARAGNWSEASDALARARALAPHEPMVRRNQAGAALALASELSAAGEPDKALQHVEVAVEAAPDSTEVALAHARALVAAARFDAAEQAFERLLAREPGSLIALYELGLLLERTGQVPALRRLLQRVPAGARTDSRISYLNALLLHRDGKTAAAHEKLLESEPGHDPERWHRLHARIADSLGRTDEAFAAMLAMNRAVAGYSDWRTRGAQYRARLRALGEQVSADWCRALPQLPRCERRSPAFLIGFPRSGTTLLDTFLMGHPQVRVLEEMPLLEAAKRGVGEIEQLASCSMEALERGRAAYLAELDRHIEPDFTGLVVDKLPLNIVGAPLIQALFPGAPIVFSQRHPCDAVLSGFMQSFVLNDAMACFLDLEDAADFYDAVLSLWGRYVAALPLKLHSLVYEELVADPRRALVPLVDFLGLEWDETMLDHQGTAVARGAISTPSYDQVTEPLNPRPSGRWLDYREQMAPVLPTLLPWAERLGYSR